MRLINADALKDKLKSESYWTYTHEFGDAIPVGWVMSAIDNAPTVEPYCYFCGQKEHGQIEERPQDCSDDYLIGYIDGCKDTRNKIEKERKGGAE